MVYLKYDRTIKNDGAGNSLAVQRLGLCAFTAEGAGSIPGRGTKNLRDEAKKKK